MTAPTAASQTPEVGALVEVRGQRWVVADRHPGSDTTTRLDLQSVEDGRYGDTLPVIWELEPGRQVLPARSLPEVTPAGFDPPEHLAAFLDAVRWSAVTSADVRRLQAPFRSGVTVEGYQLEPVARAVEAPRVNQLLSDDVGLGKTIEAGLVALELVLRHRAHRIMIVCPAGLTLKWRDEMRDKFGLDFTVVDAAQLATLKRSHGSAANPFHVYPRTIVSLPWLRGARAQRLLNEALPPESEPTTRFFDLLILDEAHHVAPAAPKQAYAVDSQQTKLLRRLAPHFEHRLFLSATPHNGYAESFTALLEILDDQRFARGVEPDPAARAETVVRRLKRDIVEPDGRPRFAERDAQALAVEYPDDERAAHALVEEFAAARRQRATKKAGRRAADLVTLLLKKRLFSSPRAFGHTVGVYLDTLRARRPGGGVPGPASGGGADDDTVPDWLQDHLDDTAVLDDEALEEAEQDALGRSARLQEPATDPEVTLLEQMRQWAERHEAQPDAKARRLIEYLTAVCRPDGSTWTNERVIVFTEYRDTQMWLVDLLTQEGLGAQRLEQLYGGMDPAERERLRLAFQADPDEHPVRILVATDSASEGIDLQRHCHRLVNYDIPFNPNKLEQRIGRIDRYGQQHPPEVRHFMGVGGGPQDADMEFLARVANKVSRMEEDLGRVNAVLAGAVQQRMLGQVTDVDIEGAVRQHGSPGTRGNRSTQLAADTNVGEQVRRLTRELDTAVQQLRITPDNIRRVVDTALDLDGEQQLTPHLDERHLAEGMFDVPPLTRSWARALHGLDHPLDHYQRPITFTPEVARGRDDVVLAHLGHPLVTMATRLLRAAVWNTNAGLHRVAAIVSDDPELEHTLVGAFSRFVLVGADGIRLHEEILHAGGWLPPTGRFRRLENLTTLGGLLDRALTHGQAAAPLVQDRLVESWPQARDGLLRAIDWRTRDRQASLEHKLAQRAESERDRIISNFDRFAASLRTALADDEDEGTLFSRAEAAKDSKELAQYRQDRQKWQRRLDELDAERDRELAKVAARYTDPQPLSFPVAVVFVVPAREATR
ncbi:DISARM system SNF2-like helicase DrmD [Lipingzhangella sp. LS1_29]|uniref:DISARM system SNF2-like helicase DrmD n=1 Tax=Lipingzhangella rawalii TaxID=2055835 RepID=A0ABU2H918_9ACTN|nr:DISARM system SNF2-like helicase DrmD [Lipingzhangella rawalii]MDS1271798.1 DISARM system SNF2-like helicase DrmD [Lipingzhangella rawalii]